MTATDEDALTCDFAETYHIFNWRELPMELAATLAIGLRENSRIRQIISGQSCPLDTFLTAVCVDRLGYMLEILTHGKFKTKSVAKLLDGGAKKQQPKKTRTFSSLEEFRQAYRDITGGGED